MLRRILLATTIVLALGGCGGSDDAQSPGPASSTATTTAKPATGEPVLAGRSEGTDSEIFWADPLTVEPLDGRSATIPFFYSVAEPAPEGDLLAVGGNERGVVQLVDLERMRPLETIELGAGEVVERLYWARSDLLLASVGGLPSQVVAVNPTTGEVLSSKSLGGVMLASWPAGEALVFLVAPTEGIGRARVARFDGSTVSSVELAEIEAGYDSEGDTSEDFRTRQQIPGLAVDPNGARALVVPAGNRVAEIDLATMEVAYHDLSQPVSLLGRLRNWLEPAAEAKLIDGPGRNAVWLPNGLVAVSGVDYSTDGDELDADFAGLSLIDPADWSVSHVSDEPGWATFRGGALLGSAWEEGSDHQTLEVFGPDGDLRFTLEREGADLSQVSGDYLYATSYDGTRFEIIDLGTGETVAEAQPRRETYLVYVD
ncbi:MAG: YncE family protein [Gaiellaceae bacterium]